MIYVVFKNDKPVVAYSDEEEAQKHAKELRKGWNLTKVVPLELNDVYLP
ncbi:hypothetical protein [Phyllobacterium endophyticum]|nr:hypothetical protein [Phyllobacterium endophyticum]